MACNLGKMERSIRIALGLILLAIGGLTALPNWGLVIGLVALLTGAAGYCPA